MKAIFSILAAALFLLFLGIDGNAASTSKIVMEEFKLSTADPGITLYVRNKHPQGVKKFPGQKNPALCARCDLPIRDRVRPEAERTVLDGLHRAPGL